MLSRLQELRKEEETLLRLKAALHDQLNRLKGLPQLTWNLLFGPGSPPSQKSACIYQQRLKVEELALQSMISSRRGMDMMMSSQPAPEESNDMLVHVDNEASINQTALKLSTRGPMMEEEEEEEEESDS